MKKNLKYIKIYWIEKLQNIFISGFIYEDDLKWSNDNDYYIIELNYKKTKDNKKEYHNISDINKIFFINESSLNNFKATTFFNLPIHEKLLQINELIFNTEIEINTIFNYKKDIADKFKNNKFNGIDIDLKLWLLSSIYYFFILNKKSIVNVSWLFSIFRVSNFEKYYKNISNYYKDNFNSNNITWEKLKNYKKEYRFDEMSLIYSVLWDLLNWNTFQKRIYDDKQENYLSIFSKILFEVNWNKREVDEKYDFFINKVFSKLRLDYYEKRYLNLIQNKKYRDENLNLLEYLLIILIKWDYSLILDNLEKFQIKEELQDHIKLICYILKWTFDWYSNLDKNIKIEAYNSKIFDFILNKTTKNLIFKNDSIKYWNLIFKIS